MQPAQIAVEREHLRAIDPIGVSPTDFGADFQQLLDPAFQIGPFAAQQGQCDAIGASLVLMHPETGRAEAFVRSRSASSSSVCPASK